MGLVLVPSYPEVLESEVGWAGVRTFKLPGTDGDMVGRLELDRRVIDDGVLCAIEALQLKIAEAMAANREKASLSLVKAP